MGSLSQSILKSFHSTGTHTSGKDCGSVSLMKRRTKQKTIDRVCPVCGRVFNAKLKDVNRGWAVCCCKSCAATRRERIKKENQMDIEQIRSLFESLFTPPESCTWCGKSYAATAYNAWDADKYAQKFEGFRAAIEWMDRNKYNPGHVKMQAIDDDEAGSLFAKWNAAVMHSQKIQAMVSSGKSDQEYLDNMAGYFLSRTREMPSTDQEERNLSRRIYNMADAMLAEKKKRYK